MDKTSKNLLITLFIILLALVYGAYVFYENSIKVKDRESDTVSPAFVMVKDSTRYSSKTLPPFQHAYLHKPDSLVEEDLLDSANFYYLQAARQFEAEANWEGYVWALNQVGKNLIRLRTYEGVLHSLNEALEKGLLHLGKEHRFVSNTYFFLGEYFYYTKQPEEALENFKHSLAIRLKLFGEVSNYVAVVYSTIGDVHEFIRLDHQTAERYYTRSLKIIEKLNENSPYELVFNYYSLANTNISKGDYDKALSYAYEALHIIESLPQKDWPFLEGCYYMVASIYNHKIQYEEAIKYLDRAIYLNTIYKGSETELAFYYNDLGKSYHELHQFAKAASYFSKALHLFANSAIIDSVGLANSYQNLGNAYKNLNQFDTALYNYEKCLQTRLAYFGTRHRETSEILRQIGTFYQENRQLDTALAYFQRAIIAGTSTFSEKNIESNPVIADIGNNFYLYEILSNKAVALQQNFHLTGDEKSLLTALHCYQLADTLMQLSSRRYDREDSKLFFTGNQQSLYEGAIDCAFLLSQLTHNNKYSLQVIHWMERSKASILFETLKEIEANNQAGIPDSIRELERSLKIDIAFYQHQLQEELNKPKPRLTTLQQLRTSVFKTSRQQERLLDQLSISYPSYFQTKYETIQVEHSDLQMYAVKTGSQIIEYFWGDSIVYGISLYKNKIKLLKINKTDTLTNAISTYLEEVSQQPDVYEADRDFALFTKNAHFLYTSLLEPLLIDVKPLTSELPQKVNSKITIIPDGLLTSIPFEALLTYVPATQKTNYQDLPYLLCSYHTSYAYSAYVLLYNYHKQHKQKEKKRNTAGLLAFSYSTANKGDTSGHNGVAELAGSARELEAIESYMDGIYLKGNEATEDAFKELAPQFSILHLAIHGQADQENHLNNHLLFKQQDTRTQDGLLYPYELYNLNLQAKLTVLSACETGVGKLYKGEGMYSIARGFAYAGCPAIVMSLWKANDQTTADIMGAFYKEISAGLEIDKSLHLAKIAYLQKGDHITAHPAYWAAFVPVGAMESVVPRRQYAYLLAAGTSVFLIILAFLVMLYISVSSGKKGKGISKKLKSYSSQTGHLTHQSTSEK